MSYISFLLRAAPFIYAYFQEAFIPKLSHYLFSNKINSLVKFINLH